MALILPFDNVTPTIAADAFVAPNATLIGRVTLGAGASVWFNAVVRGDTGNIVIGAGTNIQDGVIVHVNDFHDTIIGANVTIGHAAVVEGCTIGDGCLIGMNATILSGSVVGAGCVIAAGAVVREGATIPPNSFVVGVPGKVKGEVSAELTNRISVAAKHYVEFGRFYTDIINDQ